jgi:hypothetical protein
MIIHLLRNAVESDAEKLTLKEAMNRMPPCPICGKKAYLMHDIVDGFDFGYSGGCPVFRLDDGIHGITESYDPKAPRVDGYSAKEVLNNWLEYCEANGKRIYNQNIR